MIVAVLALAASAWVSIFRRENDFRWHYDVGEKVLATGRLYVDAAGQEFGLPYPVGRRWIDAAMALLPYRAARAMVWSLAVAALVVTLLRWERLAGRRPGLAPTTTFAAGAATLAILSRWVVRDLDECGLQLLLLFMLTMAFDAVARGRAWPGGFWLGLAGTYKATPALFLPYLLYKRRWREAVAMVTFLVVFNLVVPAVLFGPEQALDSNRRFAALTFRALTMGDPSANPFEDPKPQNQGLKMALARYLQTYPSQHPLFVAVKGQKDDLQRPLVPPDRLQPDPLFLQFGSLSAGAASMLVTGLLVGLAAALAVRFRRRWGDNTEPAGVAPEWAAVCVLSALLSPVAWQQHLVLTVPALYLVIRAEIGSGGSWRKVAIGLIAALILLPQRELLGRHLMLVVYSYKPFTAAALLAMTLVLILPRDRGHGRGRTEQAGRTDAPRPSTWP